ncbi:unnamed protein product [Tuber aestivum]|uniref:Prefoldin subunit 6 n=1 Tax=Tuber aestivum TaxID=59557 RepID=A0A292PZW8_9PEZI|nr:unnamed protein product [Tuber aestivum]
MPAKMLQDLTDQFQALSKDMSSVVEARQKLDSQLEENKSVQKEFASLSDDAKIYKLIGPVLVKQDKSEAVMNVDKRLEFINSEITRLIGPNSARIEKQISDIQEKQERKKMEIIQVQTQLQQDAQAQGFPIRQRLEELYGFRNPLPSFKLPLRSAPPFLPPDGSNRSGRERDSPNKYPPLPSGTKTWTPAPSSVSRTENIRPLLVPSTRAFSSTSAALTLPNFDNGADAGADINHSSLPARFLDENGFRPDGEGGGRRRKFVGGQYSSSDSTDADVSSSSSSSESDVESDVESDAESDAESNADADSEDPADVESSSMSEALSYSTLNAAPNSVSDLPGTVPLFVWLGGSCRRRIFGNGSSREEEKGRWLSFLGKLELTRATSHI